MFAQLVQVLWKNHGGDAAHTAFTFETDSPAERIALLDLSIHFEHRYLTLVTVIDIYRRGNNPMSDDKPSGTYSTHLSGDVAAKIEQTIDERDVNKSKVVREFIEDGIRYREERGPVEMVLLYTSAMCLAAALGLFMLTVIVAAISYPLLPAFLVGLGSLSFASAAGVFALLQRAGVGEWADRHLTARGVVA